MRKKIHVFTMILLLLVIPLLLSTNIKAASKLNLYDYGTKKNITYTGTQVNYILNEKAINMRNTPGIIIDGISLASYKDVFGKSGIKAKYKYDKPKGTVTLSYDDTTIIYTIGSTKAKVNDQTVTIPKAPIKIKFKDENVTKILVPARFTAETFGFQYVWNSSTSSASITAPLKLYYNGNNVTYSDSIGKLMIDGKNVNLGDMPGILINGTTFVRAKKVFSNSSINADYTYKKSNQEMILTKDETEVKLTMGSKTVYINGQATEMSTAPLIVKNLNKGTSYVMVPASNVASYLGYDYKWDSKASTSIITERKNTSPTEDGGNLGDDGTGNDDINDGPELGGDELLEDSVLLNKDVNYEFIDEYNKINLITNTTEISNDTETFSYINQVTKEFTIDDNMEVYSLHATAPFNKTTATLRGKSLILHINKSLVDDSAYNLGGILVESILMNYDSSNITSEVTFNLANPNSKYELSLSPDLCTLYITVYKNYIGNVEVGTLSGNDYLKLTGISDLNVEVAMDDDFLTLRIPNTINATGNENSPIASTSIKSVISAKLNENDTVIYVEKSSTSNYYISQSGNTYTVTFIENYKDDYIPGENDSDQNSGNTNPNLDKYDLSIKLPSNVKSSDILHEDRYYNNQIVIKVPGDQRNFYKENPLKSLYKVVKSISVNYQSGMTEIIINTSKIQGYKLDRLKGVIGVTIGDPSDIYKNIVVLDAGHGGVDPGAIYSGINEKDINFKIIYELTPKYFEDSDIKVYYSRYDDTKVDLYERAAFADEVEADLFVSLHLNANYSSSPKGTEIYYYSKNTSKSASGLTSYKLASMVLDYLPKAIGTNKRYVHDKNYVVIREANVPSILVELAFMSNKDDMAKIKSEAFQEKSAEALYDVLCEVFKKYPTGR